MTAAALIARYGRPPPGTGVLFDVPFPPTTAEARGLGPLLEMFVERFDGTGELWRFGWEADALSPSRPPMSPMPRLVYHARNTRLWSMGGNFVIDGGGFRTLGSGQPLRFLKVADAERSPELAEQLADYRWHHRGLPPQEIFNGLLTSPRNVILVGRLGWLRYRVDRNDGDGLSNWRHYFLRSNLPFVAVAPHGRRFWFLGGAYTVRNGWIHH